MKIFLKLNALSSVFGFVFFCMIELMLNTYRISNVSGLDIQQYQKYSSFIYLFIFLFSTILLLAIEKYLIEFRKVNFWAAGLWIPYFFFFTAFFNNVFPFNDPAGVPGPGAGILILFAFLFYPFYVATIVGVGMGFHTEK